MDHVNIFNIRIYNNSLIRFISILNNYNQKGFVVTPNVDHIVKLDKDAEFKRAYDNALFALPDGMPIVLVSRLIGCPIKERIAGSDLFYHLLSFCEKNHKRIFLLGAQDAIRKKALVRLAEEYPNLMLGGSYSPPFGFENDKQQNDKIVEFINNTGSDLLLIFLGAPKQEKWINEHIDRLNIQLAFCLGASLDFYVGEFQRAPLWMQRMGLEWFWRMLSDRRLVKRYLIDDLLPFAKLTIREFRASRSGLKK